MPKLASRDTRGAILTTALELFGARGYEATSLREIAERLGVTKAALYYHFPAKEDVLLALVEPVMGEVEAVLARRLPPVAMLEAYLDLLIDQRAVLGFIMREPAALNHPRLGRRTWEVTAKARSTVAGGATDEATLVRAAAAIGALHAGVLAVDPERLPAHRDTLLAAARSALEGGAG